MSTDAIEVSEAPAEGSALEAMGSSFDDIFGDDLEIFEKIHFIDMNHDDFVWRSSEIEGSAEEKIHFVVMGRVGQRTMWDKKDRSAPTCKSPNNAKGIGYATNRLTIAPTGLTADVNGESLAVAATGLLDILPTESVQLDCSKCRLGSNGKDQDEDYRQRECQQVSAMIIMVDFHRTGIMRPAVMQLKSTSTTPLLGLLDAYKAKNVLPWTQLVEGTLNKTEKNGDTWAIPQFKLVGETAPELHEAWATDSNEVKSRISTYFAPSAEDADKSMATVTTASEVPPSADGEDDEDF